MSSKVKKQENQNQVSIVYWVQSELEGNLTVVFQLQGTPESLVATTATHISNNVAGIGFDRRAGSNIILVKKKKITFNS